MIDDVQSRLKDCLSTLDHLQRENRQLRQAAEAFGALAERLNRQLVDARARAAMSHRLESEHMVQRDESSVGPDVYR
jgi:predicted RNase H-like nuclease (RuvC/YqgF family)